MSAPHQPMEPWARVFVLILGVALVIVCTHVILNGGGRFDVPGLCGGVMLLVGLTIDAVRRRGKSS